MKHESQFALESRDVGIISGLPPELALGQAVALIMTKPAFAGAPFGHIARCLAGQVNRGHYAFAKRAGQTVGFAGWALVDRTRAEAWLAGTAGFSDRDAEGGDCVVLNFWQADTPDVTRALIAHLAAVIPAAKSVYAKRHYPDGRVRPVHLDLRQAVKT